MDQQSNFPDRIPAIKIPRVFFEIQDGRSLFFFFANTAVILCMGPLSYWLATWWGYVFAFVLVAMAGDALLKLQHEAMHGVLVNNKVLNANLGRFISALVGTRYYDATTIHMRHHTRLGSDDDPNLYWYGEKKNILVFMLGQMFGAKLWMFFSRTAVLLIRSIFPRYSDKLKTNTSLDASPVVVNKIRGIDDLVMLVSVQGVLFGLITWYTSWWVYVVFIILPPSTVGSLLESIRSFSEHARSNTIASNIAERRRLFWVVSNPLELTCLSQFGFHYHHLHHLYPTIPVFNLPKLHAWMMEEFSDYQDYFVVRKSYVRTLYRRIVGQTLE